MARGVVSIGRTPGASTYVRTHVHTHTHVRGKHNTQGGEGASRGRLLFLFLQIEVCDGNLYFIYPPQANIEYLDHQCHHPLLTINTLIPGGTSMISHVRYDIRTDLSDPKFKEHLHELLIYQRCLYYGSKWY